MVRSLVQRKYDKDSKLWIPDYYVLYAYWYRFLQIAVEENRDIDWTRYEGWGGPEVIQNTKFRKWWLEHWKELFGVKTELGVSRSSRRFRLSTKKPKRNAIKVALRVYENKHRGENWEIMEYLNKKYVEKKGIEKYLERRKQKVNIMGSIDAGAFGNAVDTKEVNRTINRYMSQAEKHLDNVCVGKFP